MGECNTILSAYTLYRHLDSIPLTQRHVLHVVKRTHQERNLYPELPNYSRYGMMTHTVNLHIDRQFD